MSDDIKKQKIDENKDPGKQNDKVLIQGGISPNPKLMSPEERRIDNIHFDPIKELTQREKWKHLTDTKYPQALQGVHSLLSYIKEAGFPGTYPERIIDQAQKVIEQILFTMVYYGSISEAGHLTDELEGI